MPQYRAPINDMQFLLKDWLNIESHYQSLGLGDLDFELVSEILNQGAKFSEEALSPINREGDEISCKLADGKVTTPPGFAEAYQEYIANGWCAMLGSAEYDGQELPYSIAVPVNEMSNSANVSWRLVSMLTESAVLAIDKHGSEEIKQQYLRPLISGEWTGTMNLTEPQAGTDLSLLSTKAEDNGDGSYSITGNKIFISGGDQDWSSNIIHLVLARLPDAPPGVKGISLFVVPKFELDENGQPGKANALSVGSLEKKMGIKACPTCVMNFDGARGWLLGGPNQGLACMFTMMNDARFNVGLQGLGLAEASYQGALEYARERLQSRAPQGPQEPEKKADPIINQPDVRRMLLTQKALNEGSRALAYLYAMQMDNERFGDDEQRHKADQVLAFLTPICKAFMTDMSQEVTNLGVQVYGGHGYIREWGMEQLVRDSRITQLYEGTNGIQAADLIGRKLVRNNGEMMKVTAALFADLVAKISDDEHKQQASALLDEWQQTSVSLLSLNAIDMAGASNDYLQYSAYMLIGVLWLSMADTAQTAENEQIKQGKAKTCAFYIKRLLPRAEAYKQNLLAAADDLMAVQGGEFDYL